MSVEISRCLQKIDATGDRYRLKRTIAAINNGLVEGESGIVVGQCKSLLETLCKSILKEQACEVEAAITMPKLAKNAVKALNVGNTGNQDQKTKEAFIKLIQSFTMQLENATSAVAALRNDYCPLAHGRSYEEPQLHMIYAHLIATQTDSLTTFILELIDQHRNFVPEIKFTDNDDYNDYLYETYKQLEIYGDHYQAPEVLFNMNPEKYKRGLEEYKEGASDVE
ncbi:abortive infection family protein [Serratia sp. JSRIV002]|uniref:abortive infection family protein n=1 Tax=Serratia sp. JSRIV002 TaxID=2831894 RepID=UPI001CBC0596|nr:abortive infection family protein [Serratia sp. JSRIV002]UAN51665.1 abortive infection family protein [Serratia sp. JSRIV002]